MVKKIIITLIGMVLVGCATVEPAPKIVYQTVEIPVTIVPAPPVIDRPKLEIENIDQDEQNANSCVKNVGELSKAYVITVEQLQDYATKLEAVIATYDDLSKGNLISTKK